MRQFRTLINQTKCFLFVLCIFVISCIFASCINDRDVQRNETYTSAPVTFMVSGVETQNESIAFPDGQLSPGQDMPEWMYAVKDVELRAFSHMDAPVTKTISNRIVQVLASAYYDEQWLLIYSTEADSSYGALGWVEASQLQEQATITELNYPVRLRSGAIDIDSGEIIEFLGADMAGEDIWAKEYTDGTVTVYWEGGNIHRVSPNDVIIPQIIDGELRFIDEE